ncbi:hypothetical protein BTVI_40003 [Pitangus sulphuratus]|nr:hypothetical protein BTVI_40003 [Pitangus sulphuratus]
MENKGIQGLEATDGLSLESNQRIWNGLGWKDLKAHLIPPSAMGKDTFHYPRLLLFLLQGLFLAQLKSQASLHSKVGNTQRKTRNRFPPAQP